MRFSQRYGYKPIKEAVQIESIDEETRNGLWTALQIHYWDLIQNDHDVPYPRLRLSYGGNRELALLCQRMWINLFKKPIDTMPDDWKGLVSRGRTKVIV